MPWYDHLPIQLGQASEKFHFLVVKKIFRHVLEVAPNITAMVNLLPKPLKKSNGLKGNHTNIGKTVAPK